MSSRPAVAAAPTLIRPAGASARRTAREIPREAPACVLQLIVTALVIIGPLAGVAYAIAALYGRGVTGLDLALAVLFYVVSGHGVTAGYHRLLTHRGFSTRRLVRNALAVCGSLAFEGSVLSWVANHRRHHAYTDRSGDPHSPYVSAGGELVGWRGFLHSHLGWLWRAQPTDEPRWAPDLVGERDLVFISRLFPLFCVVSLALPAALGWVMTGRASGALGAFIWAGLVRVFLLQHATFAVNSACHLWGRRPFRTRTHDRATNFAPLALLSMGESWHNAHHAFPALARHGVDRFQLDSTGRLIWLLERAGLAWDVKWPRPDALEARRNG